MSKPICFLDVDGVINTVSPNEETGNMMECEGFRICMPKRTKERIEWLSKHFTMVWCTTWEHMANKHFTPYWGLEEWPVVEWRLEQTTHREFKLDGIRRYLEANAEGCPFVFIDDDAAWELLQWPHDITAEFPQSHQIIIPELREGLTDENVIEAVKFAEGLEENGTTT